jgi:hypothetical protein
MHRRVLCSALNRVDLLHTHALTHAPSFSCAHAAMVCRERRRQAQLNVTTLRLKQKSAEFLSTFTPQVHDGILESIHNQRHVSSTSDAMFCAHRRWVPPALTQKSPPPQMLREMAASKDKLVGHVLGGMRSVRVKRVLADEGEARGVARAVRFRVSRFFFSAVRVLRRWLLCVCVCRRRLRWSVWRRTARRSERRARSSNAAEQRSACDGAAPRTPNTATPQQPTQLMQQHTHTHTHATPPCHVITPPYPLHISNPSSCIRISLRRKGPGVEGSL